MTDKEGQKLLSLSLQERKQQLELINQVNSSKIIALESFKILNETIHNLNTLKVVTENSIRKLDKKVEEIENENGILTFLSTFTFLSSKKNQKKRKIN